MTPTELSTNLDVTLSDSSPVVGIQPTPAAQKDGKASASQLRETRPVLHVINGEHYSGAERVQDLLALCLPAHGYEVGFACVKPDKFLTSRKSQQAVVHSTRMANKFDFRVVTELVQFVRQHNYRRFDARLAQPCQHLD